MGCCRRWLLACVLVCAQAACSVPAAPAAPAAPAGAPWLIATAEVSESPGEAIPAGDWKPVALPQLWYVPDGTAVGQRWFRLHLPLAQVPATPLALYIPRLNNSARVYVNGALVATLGSFVTPMPLNWNRAQYLPLPPSLLHAGDNLLYLQVRTHDYTQGRLSPVTVGEEDALGRVYRVRRFWQNDLVMMLSGTMAVAGLLVLGVWAGRRQHSAYLWFGVALLAWCVISLDYFAYHAPVRGAVWDRLVESAQVLHAVALYMFILRHVGRRRPHLEALLWTWWALGSVAGVAFDLPAVYVYLWYRGTLLAAVYFVALLVVDAWRRRISEAVLLAVAGAVNFALSGWDLWLYEHPGMADRVYLAHFGAALYIGTVGWTLLRRGVEAMTAQETANAVLEQRVAAKAAEVEQRMAELFEARRSEAVALERARLMSEMHDGVGSQLTTALSLVEREGSDASGVAQVLRESIDDLQIIIDSLEPMGNDLLTTLGMLRYRMQRRLQQGGITIEWNVHDLPPLPVLTPHNVLSILRVLQEAFANVIRHSGASRVAVATSLESSWGMETACIRIADNGHGIGVGGQGRGMESMRRRAQALGGELHIDTGAAGTTLTLRIPTGRAT